MKHYSIQTKTKTTKQKNKPTSPTPINQVTQNKSQVTEKVSTSMSSEGGSFTSGNTGDDEVQQQQQLLFHGSSGSQAPAPPVKKKRNLPGTPDPTAEVIALSPTTLMATNRFICEICNKGFQRDQNLQLHRRGHNLPWKLRQRTSAEVKKRVYICPETSCVHHNPSRALGDLTGIKKHFCRKHGEKKWKCDKCSKKYAVQSDWKAHSKTCGTREYKCDCGTIFSRRDSFITHRAFCDALAEENNKLNQQQNLMASMVPPAMQAQVSDLMAHQSSMMMPPPPPPPIGSSSPSDFGSSPDTKNPLKSISNDPTPLKSLAMAHNGGGPMFFGPRTSTSLQLSGTLTYAGSAHMSATALLQKAAQMGATASGDSPMNQRSFMAGLVGGGGMIHPAHGPYDIQSAHMEGFSGPYEVHGLSEVGIFPDAGLYGMVSGDRPGPTTVDFLGVGGPSHVSQEFEQQQRYGFPQQVPSQAQASMERTIWDV